MGKEVVQSAGGELGSAWGVQNVAEGVKALGGEWGGSKSGTGFFEGGWEWVSKEVLVAKGICRRLGNLDFRLCLCLKCFLGKSGK